MMDEASSSKRSQLDVRKAPNGGGLYTRPLCIYKLGVDESLSLVLQVARDPEEGRG